MSDERGWQQAVNLLCVRLDSLGDVLMTTPALRALKESAPARKVTLLTSESGSRVAPLIPEVDATIVYDPPWMKASRQVVGSEPEFEMVTRLRRCSFDAAVIFTTFSQSPLPAALIAFLAGIPLRLAHCRENPYNLLTDWVPETDHFGQSEIRHEVRRQLDLVASVGSVTSNERLSLGVSPRVVENVREVLAQIRLEKDKPWLVIHPGSTAPSRRYPAEGFAEVARTLSTQYGVQVLFTGTEPEIQLVETIRHRMAGNSFSLAGKLSLPELSALLSISPLLVSNNTGPVHMAAALGTPVVDLYALTNPQHTPWMVPHRTLYYDVPCKFCYKSVCPLGHQDCLRLVPPQAVVTATLELLEEINSPFMKSGVLSKG